MANRVHGRGYIIDTADSSTILNSANMKVKSVRWVNATAAGHQAIIHDGGGDVVWESVANGADYVEAQLTETWWQGGFSVPTLDSGTLYIEYM